MPKDIKSLNKDGDVLSVRTLGSLIASLAGELGQAILKIGVLYVLARLLTPDEHGMAGAAAVVITVFGIMAKFGVSAGLVQLFELEEADAAAAFHLSFVFGVVFTLLVVILSPFLAEAYRIPELNVPIMLLAVKLFFTGLGQVPLALLQRSLRFRVIAVINVLSYGVGYGAVAIVLSLLGVGYWALVWGLLTQEMVKTACLLKVQRVPVKHLQRWFRYRRLLTFGAGHALSELGLSGAYQADNFIVGRYLGASSLGLYTRAFQVLSMPTTLVGNGLGAVLFPAFSRIQHDSKRLANTFRRALDLTVLLGLVISVVFVMFAPEIVIVLLGNQWVEVIPLFTIMGAAICFRIVHKLGEAGIRAKGQVYRLASTQWLYLASVSVAALIGQFYGLYGVAIGVAIAITLNCLVILSVAFRLLGISTTTVIHCLMQPVVVAIVFACVSFGLRKLTALWGMPPFLVLLVSLGAIGLLAVLIFFGAPRALSREAPYLRKILLSFLFPANR